MIICLDWVYGPRTTLFERLMSFVLGDCFLYFCLDRHFFFPYLSAVLRLAQSRDVTTPQGSSQSRHKGIRRRTDRILCSIRS